jgi:hypothetical protein
MDLGFNKLQIAEEGAENISYAASKSQKKEDGDIIKSSQHTDESNCSDDKVPNNEHSSTCRCRDPDYMPSFEPEDLVGINSWVFRQQVDWVRYSLDPYQTGSHHKHQATRFSIEKYEKEIDEDSDEDSDVEDASEGEEEDSPAARALLELLRGDDDEDSADENNNSEE